MNDSTSIKIGVYAGSFDPITNGHLWMIKKGSELFDKLVVAIAVNPEKKYMFQADERLGIIEKVTAGYSNVEIGNCGNDYLVNYAKSIGARYIIRGIRSEDDYEKERQMRYINSDLYPEIETVFFIPPKELVEVSSSFVKGLIGYNGWEDAVKRYVPSPVHEKILDVAKNARAR